MNRREVLRGEIKYLKNSLGIDINTGKLDSIEECREAIINIINEQAKILTTNERAATDDMKEQCCKLALENKIIKQNYNDLIAILKNIQSQSEKKSFFKRLFGGK